MEGVVMVSVWLLWYWKYKILNFRYMNVIVETSMSSSSRSLIYKRYNLDARLFPLDKPKQPYKDNIRIPSANIKFTSTSFRNRKESMTFVRFSFLFRGEYIYKLYSSYQCTYIVLILQCHGIHSQGHLNTIIGSREKQCTGDPYQQLSGIQM